MRSTASFISFITIIAQVCIKHVSLIKKYIDSQITQLVVSRFFCLFMQVTNITCNECAEKKNEEKNIIYLLYIKQERAY
jgi:hypothetical protein